MKFKNKGKSWWPTVVAVALTVLAVWWGVRLWKGKGTEDLQILRTVKVERETLSIKVESLGEVKPYNRVEMKAPIAGRVDEILVQEGDEVKKGQVLAWMSSTERAALLDAARSQGEEVLKRWQDTYKSAPLISPLDGTIIVRAVEPGQTVTTADPILVISDELIIKAMVDETDLAQIAKGQKAEIALDAYRGRKIPGTVKHISYESLLVNNVNMYEVDVRPLDAPDFLRSGMTASVSFVVMEHENILSVPSEAVAQLSQNPAKRGQAPALAVYKKGFGDKPVAVPVEIGASDGRLTEITRGLSEGDQVFVIRKKEKENNTFSPFGGRPGGNRPQKRG